MDPSSNSVNLVIHNANGQQQLIKIMRNPNGQPLTQEGVKAIVKEVTGQDASKMLGKSLTSNTSAPRPFVNSTDTAAYHPQQPQAQQPKYHDTPATSGSYHQSGPSKSTPVAGSSSSFKLSSQQMASVKQAVSKQGTSKMQSHGSSSSFATSSPTISTKKTRRRKTDRVGKGLRHFSMKVCEKVKEKGTTTYNEVADELVEEFCSQEAKGQPIDPANYDQKNIRRRVYDALNVLMAMNIISKDKKEIRWIGLPTNSAQQCSNLEKENQTRKERIEAKQQQLRELILQQVSFKSLVTRNRESEERGLVPSPTSAIQLPFIIVNAHKKTTINCSISGDKSEYHFNFDDKFEIHDDIEVLKRMGLLLGLDTGECSYEDIERAKTMVPKTFEKYIEIYGRGEDDILSWHNTMLEDSICSNLILKNETMSDEEILDDEQYTDASDME